MTSVPPRILIVAGEASGDHHAARLVAALKARLPGAEFLGLGGEALAAQGVRILFPADKLATMGVVEVVGHLPQLWRALALVNQVLRDERPVLAILVDYPDFNFWVARFARWHRVPVMYYISPQVWAWRTYRVRTIARLVDRMVVIFPFEAEFYRQRGVPVDFVGHPFQETLPNLPPRRELSASFGLDSGRFTLALLPGSRAFEIQRNLPAMLAGAALVQQAIPECQFLLPLASTAPQGLVEGMVDEWLGQLPPPGPSFKIVSGQAYAALAAAHLAVAASGTVTVEAALAGTPTIVVYRLSPLTYVLGKLLIRVDFIGMANLLAGEGVFPELIQADFTPQRLAREVLELVGDPARLPALRRGLTRVVRDLGGPGASARAAHIAVQLICKDSKG